MTIVLVVVVLHPIDIIVVDDGTRIIHIEAEILSFLRRLTRACRAAHGVVVLIRGGLAHLGRSR
ncbi:hypothetical protein C2E23DRAFT_845131 [Lenzites betulinus]|nr:hypothetical protein C2E23DRAFT_845131 [Lenzites betulinus]